MEQPNLTEFGVIGVVLIVLFWVMKFASTFFMAKKTDRCPEYMELTKLVREMHVLYSDPMVRQQIKELHTMTLETEKQKNKGHFNCVWRGRDEVRDLMDTMKHMVEATEALTVEMRLSRNGVGKAKGA